MAVRTARPLLERLHDGPEVDPVISGDLLGALAPVLLHELGEQFMAEVYWRQALEKGYDARQIEERLKQPAKTPSAE